MTDKSRSFASFFRKLVAALILVPLAVIIVAFAVANRQFVTVSFDPFSTAEPAAALSLPLFLVLFAVLIVGVVIGGFASWLRHGRGRWAVRRLEREVARLHDEIDAHKRLAGTPPNPPETAKPPEPLKLQAPVR